VGQIDGEIPTIDSKYAKMEGFALHNRKTSPYIPRNELRSPSNRKTSAYFTFNDHLIKGKTAFLIIGQVKTSIHRGDLLSVLLL
jgi:hypothetical protein